MNTLSDLTDALETLGDRAERYHAARTSSRRAGDSAQPFDVLPGARSAAPRSRKRVLIAAAATGVLAAAVCVAVLAANSSGDRPRRAIAPATHGTTASDRSTTTPDPEVAAAIATLEHLCATDDDPTPTGIEYVQSTAEVAERFGFGGDSYLADDTATRQAARAPVLVMIAAGAFVDNISPLPPGFSQAHESYLSAEIILSNSKTADYGLLSSPLDLAKLGTVVYVPRRYLRHRPASVKTHG